MPRASSVIKTSSLMSLGLGRVTRPQQDVDLWIGHTSLGRSLMGISSCWVVRFRGMGLARVGQLRMRQELRFLPGFAHFIHRYFVSTLRIALTSIKQLFSLVGVDG